MQQRGLSGRALLDLDVFISYLKGDELSDRSAKVVMAATKGSFEALVSSILYDELISVLRLKGMGLDRIMDVLVGVASIPHRSLPITPEIAMTAVEMYREHGGPRKLHYFDSFHVATAVLEGIPMITSDEYILKNANSLGLMAIDLRKV